MSQPLDRRGFENRPMHADTTVWARARLAICFLPLRRLPLGDSTLLFKIDVPSVLLPLFVLQLEGEDSVGLLHCIFPPSIIRLEGAVDDIKGGG